MKADLCSAQTRGGGNAGNALTAASRLGADCYLVTKLGDDGIGDQIASELKKDGVNLQFVLRAKESVSDFTYLIIDKSGALAANAWQVKAFHIHTYQVSCLL